MLDEDSTRPRRALVRTLLPIGGALLVGLGVVIGREALPPDVLGAADPVIASMLEDRIEALNAGDADELERFYSDDAILEEWDRGGTPVVTIGGAEIANRLARYQSMGLRVERESVATQYGTVAPFVAEQLSWWADESGGTVVYRLDDEGRIAHQWLIGGSFPPEDAANR